ncbi:MAG: NAD+ synthase [Pseudomonadota bacterium]
MTTNADSVKVVLAQLNPLVGDVAGNLAMCIDAIHRARDKQGADLVVLPEMILCGYPPEDLLLHAGLQRRVSRALETLRAETGDIAVIVGYPEYADGRIYNAACVLSGGERIAEYRKWLLPNYQVFDEKRYFTPGDTPTLFAIGGITFGLTICEDVWEPPPAAAAAEAGAACLIAINGSPYSEGAQQRREQVVRERASAHRLPVMYTNMVGGQDELVFDGGSFVMTGEGDIVGRAAPFVVTDLIVDVQRDGDRAVTVEADTIAPLLAREDSIYRALVCGTRDYVRKNGFPGIILGLSGGIDSALTMSIAVDALGADAVHAVMMPYHYTSDMSREDAALQAQRMGVTYDVISIAPMVEATLGQLAPLFAGLEEDTTEENIQSRSRGVLLMALSNKTGRMLLTTGNKSEMAVGYATLYGDMAGGFAPLKDCSKLTVFALARHRNSLSPEAPPIPQRVIDRPPSAELRPDQEDTDSLPPYEILDAILAAFVERDLSVDDICELGFDRDTVVRVLSMVRRNEYKRRQAPPGVRVSRRAFGRDWRYPITSGYVFPEDV